MSHRRLLVVAVAVVVALGPVASGCGASPSGSGVGAARSGGPDGVHVTGYAMEGSATPASITRDGELVQTVGIDGVVLRGPRRVSPVSSEALRLRTAARRAGRATTLLVSNFDGALGDFDEPLAHRMLGSPRNRRDVVRALVRRAAGFDGLQVDLESLRPRDRRGLVALTRELRRALPHHELSMAVMAGHDARGYAARGYDLGRLAPLLDTVVLMSYDQHGPTWSGPGPIASLPWVRRELAYLLTRVPRSKVDLGVAGYGYQWGARPSTLSVARARKVAGSRARWSETHAEWHAELPGGRTLWWDDARSFAVRRDLAAAEHLHGVAVWQLGSSGALTP